MKNKISYIEAYIDYDKEIFEEVTSKDFSNSLNENTLSYFSYSNKANKIVVEFDEDTEVTELCKLKLKVLDNIEDISTTKFKVSHGNCYSYNDDKTIEFGDVTETFAENNDEEKLYLSTEKYKIGENNIKDYEDGDKYISRITKETKLKDYINNLKTNGEITVTKEDGTKLTEDELVGTGMTLIVTKDNEKIELKIAVSGDLNGDGKVEGIRTELTRTDEGCTGFPTMGTGVSRVTFDGQNNRLDNIYMYYYGESEKGIALFSEAKKISNLIISGKVLNKKGDAASISLSAQFYSSEIDNCINYADVTGYGGAGGITARTKYLPKNF